MSYDDGEVPMPKQGEGYYGRHSVILIGYDDKTGKINFQNSWGEDYGDNGFGYFPYDYILDNHYEILLIIPTPLLYKNLIVYHSRFEMLGNKILRIGQSFVKGYTITHNNILLFDLYDSNNEISGWIIASKINDYCLEIIDFFVWPDKRNMGYGDLLLNNFLGFAFLWNIKSCFGWVSLDDTRTLGKDRALSFFTKRGFRYMHDPDMFPWSPGKIEFEL